MQKEMLPLQVDLDPTQKVNLQQQVDLQLMRKHQANLHKAKGFSALSIVEFIFSVVLHGMSFSRALESNRIPKEFHKVTVYDLLKNPTYNWRKLLVLVSSYLIQKYIRPLTSEVRDCVLIFDDSAFYRNRSKCVELLARAKDHAHNVYFKGFRMLTLGWSHGATFMPLAFSQLSSPKAKNRYQEIDPRIDKKAVGYKRRKEAVQKTTDTMFDLLDAIDPEKLGAKTTSKIGSCRIIIHDDFFCINGLSLLFMSET